MLDDGPCSWALDEPGACLCSNPACLAEAGANQEEDDARVELYSEGDANAYLRAMRSGGAA